ncbi:hypothetical protein N7517_005316 [Penicillium concentricum]|uniref:RING-type domain-containing protein n=1 Tax=Penicillium concentricum TaxID=293559 RepID=A0A9W9S7J9_9EURO|nr:uncharacterized protein N7517_005316 [Penicillium concentricum]KAJ5373310.1 hypothetical protein N7517_005316 [Penicillium concentricum]
MGHDPGVEITALDKPQKVKMAARSGSGAEASGLVNTLQGHVDDIRTLIQCGICIRPLYEPFTIACGHTFCYSCLSSWFAGGRSKRTCPDCRAPVKTQPAPAYLVRAVVQMFTGRAELLDRGETTMEHSKNQRDEAERLDQDKANSHPTEGGLFGGLFKPKAPPLKPVIDIDDGVVRCPLCSWELEGDDCAGCGYRYRPDSEDTDDSGSADFSETDLDSLEDGIDEDPEEGEGGAGESDHFDEIEDQDGVWGNFALQWYRDPFSARPNWPSGVGTGQAFDRLESLMGSGGAMIRTFPVIHENGPASGNTNGSEYDEEEEDEEENEYDESDSFIDAENDHPPTSSFVEDQVHRLGSGDMYESESDRSTGTVVDDIQGGHHSLPIGLNYRNTTPYFDDEASDDEEEEVSAESDDREMVDEEEDESESDEDAIQTAPPRQANAQYPRQSPWFQAPSDAPWLAARPPIQIPDSSEEEEEDSPPPVRPGRSNGARRPIPRGTTAQNVITLDDSDDDQPVGPVRRTTQRRRARFSPY